MRTPLERQELAPVSALTMQGVLPVWDSPVRLKKIADTTDMLLHGQRVQIFEVGPDESFDENIPYNALRFGRMLRYVTDYGYEGYTVDGGERIQPLEYFNAFYTKEDIGAEDAERMENLWQQYADIAEAYAEAYREVEENGYGNIYNRHAKLKTVWAPCADLLSEPDITDTSCDRMMLFRGAKILAAEDQSGVKEGWTKVYPLKTMFYQETSFADEEDFADADGDEDFFDDGAYYIRSSALEAPFELVDIDYDEASKMADCAVYGHVTPKDEAAFRKNVVETAMLYLHTQYRWAGKTINGIDCSGLCSMAYMLNGVYIYRDADIEEGYPVHEIVSAEEWKTDREAALKKLKPGDLIYYKGHVTMYIGDHCYIHSTGKAGSDGVVINSFDENDPRYRKDLAEEIKYAGSIFTIK